MSPKDTDYYAGKCLECDRHTSKLINGDIGYSGYEGFCVKCFIEIELWNELSYPSQPHPNFRNGASWLEGWREWSSAYGESLPYFVKQVNGNLEFNFTPPTSRCEKCGTTAKICGQMFGPVCRICKVEKNLCGPTHELTVYKNKLLCRACFVDYRLEQDHKDAKSSFRQESSEERAERWRKWAEYFDVELPPDLG